MAETSLVDQCIVAEVAVSIVGCQRLTKSVRGPEAPSVEPLERGSVPPQFDP
jgi:hypothetical protein